MGNKFVVFCDHKPLRDQNVRSRPNEELGDMMSYLHQFDFEIRYRPGEMNIEADCLSRNPVLEPEQNNLKEVIRAVNTMALQEIREDQRKIEERRKDEICRNGIRMRIRKGKEKVILTREKGRELIAKVH